jgi:hypothetical protein
MNDLVESTLEIFSWPKRGAWSVARRRTSWPPWFRDGWSLVFNPDWAEGLLHFIRWARLDQCAFSVAGLERLCVRP